MAKSKSGNPILDQLTLIEARLAQLEKAKKSIKASDISDKNFLGERYYKELNINRKALGIGAHWADGLTGKKINNVNTLYEALQKRRSMLKSALGQRYLEVGKTNPILREFKVKGVESGEVRGLNPLWLQEYDSDHKVEDNVPDTKKKDLSIQKIGLTKEDQDTNYTAAKVSENLQNNKTSLKEKAPLGLEEKLAQNLQGVGQRDFKKRDEATRKALESSGYDTSGISSSDQSEFLRDLRIGHAWETGKGTIMYKPNRGMMRIIQKKKQEA